MFPAPRPWASPGPWPVGNHHAQQAETERQSFICIYSRSPSCSHSCLSSASWLSQSSNPTALDSFPNHHPPPTLEKPSSVKLAAGARKGWGPLSCCTLFCNSQPQQCDPRRLTMDQSGRPCHWMPTAACSSPVTKHHPSSLPSILPATQYPSPKGPFKFLTWTELGSVAYWKVS